MEEKEKEQTLLVQPFISIFFSLSLLLFHYQCPLPFFPAVQFLRCRSKCPLCREPSCVKDLLLQAWRSGIVACFACCEEYQPFWFSQLRFSQILFKHDVSQVHVTCGCDLMTHVSLWYDLHGQVGIDQSAFLLLFKVFSPEGTILTSYISILLRSISSGANAITVKHSYERKWTSLRSDAWMSSQLIVKQCCGVFRIQLLEPSLLLLN